MVVYYGSDPCMGHGNYGVITPLSIGVQRWINHYGFAQFIVGFGFDPAVAYQAYCHSVEIDWWSLRPSNARFCIPLVMVVLKNYLSLR